MTPSQARRLLELDGQFDDGDLASARRRALKRHHPDHGGSREMMERIEAAVDVLTASSSVSASDGAPGAVSSRQRMQPGHLVQDCPSFTMDVLPVEAFEALWLAAAALDADVADEEPPYVLEVFLRSPIAAWCRCEVVPEAGGSIVTLTSDIGDPDSLDTLRDLWIDAINELRPL